MSKRRKYSEEFKREAVGMTLVEGVTLAQVARELGIGANMLGRWRRELQRKQGCQVLLFALGRRGGAKGEA